MFEIFKVIKLKTKPAPNVMTKAINCIYCT